MRLKLLGIVLTAPVAFNSLASTEFSFFTPEKVSTDISLGTLSGKTKNAFTIQQKAGAKLASLTGNIITLQLLKVQSTGI